MKASQITDRESLEAWLKTRPREDSIAIAHRAAMRVLPLWGAAMGDDWARKRGQMDLRVIRCSLISAASLLVPKVNFSDFAALAADAANEAANAALDAAAQYASSSAYAAVFAARSTYAIGTAASYNASAIANAVAYSGFAIVRTDAELLEAGQNILHEPLWHGTVPNWFDSAEVTMLNIWAEDPQDTWHFWVRWWGGAQAGKPINPDLQLAIVQELNEDDWSDPVEAAKKIKGIEARFAGPDPSVPQLSASAIVDFDFDTVHNWMVLTDFREDTEHLQDAALKEAFLNDCEDLCDDFQDFLDYAKDEMKGTYNQPAPLLLSAEKLLAEIHKIDASTRFKARRLIKMAKDLELEATRTKQRDLVGEGNARRLDEALDLFRGICRKHLGPVLSSLEPLNQFNLGERNAHDLAADVRKLVHLLRSENANGFVRLDSDAKAALRDLSDNLQDLSSQLAEANSDERRSYLKDRFTQSYAATVATIKRLAEKAAPHVAQGNRVFNYFLTLPSRWKKLEELIAFIKKMIEEFPKDGGGGV